MVAGGPCTEDTPKEMRLFWGIFVVPIDGLPFMCILYHIIKLRNGKLNITVISSDNIYLAFLIPILILQLYNHYDVMTICLAHSVWVWWFESSYGCRKFR